MRRHRVDDATLVVPDTVVIDGIAVDRLHAQLARHGTEVGGVFAPILPVPPGSSYRVVAERAALLPSSVAFATSAPVRGAALVRAGTDFDVAGEEVAVRGGATLADPGAASHDPIAPVGALEPAVAESRSPFPRAPLVLFLGLQPESGTGDLGPRPRQPPLRARGRGSPRDRFATPAPAPEPALPAESRNASERCRPDVIVTLDEAALTVAPRWCDRRSTVIVHHSGERTLSTDVLSWQIGESLGRLRALIGGRVDAPTLASLCNRLCAGPFPEPPVRSAATEDPPLTVRVPRRSLRVAVVHGPRGPGTRLESFLDEAALQGAQTDTFGPTSAASATEHDVVLVSGDLDEDTSRQLLQARADRGRKTVVDVSDEEQLTPVVEACGRATAPTRAVRKSLERRGVTVRMLPSLTTRVRLAELRQARRSTQDPTSVLGLVVDARADDQVQALGTAVTALLGVHGGLTVHVVGLGEGLAEALRPVPRLVVLPEASPADLARWRAQAWVGSAIDAGHDGRPRRLVEAGCLGIPTVFPLACRGDIDDALVSRWAIADPSSADQWLSGLEACLSDTVEVAELARRSDLLFGSNAGMSVVNRILGWASFVGAD